MDLAAKLEGCWWSDRVSGTYHLLDLYFLLPLNNKPIKRVCPCPRDVHSSHCGEVPTKPQTSKWIPRTPRHCKEVGASRSLCDSPLMLTHY